VSIFPLRSAVDARRRRW